MPGSAITASRSSRKFPAVLRDQRLRAGAQIARSRVIPQPRPQMQHLIQGRRRERLHVGKPRHEALVVGNHRGDLGLLQHHLRHPHPVGRRVLLPRQIVAAMDSNQASSRSVNCAGSKLTWRTLPSSRMLECREGPGAETRRIPQAGRPQFQRHPGENRQFDSAFETQVTACGLTDRRADSTLVIMGVDREPHRKQSSPAEDDDCARRTRQYLHCPQRSPPGFDPRS